MELQAQLKEQQLQQQIETLRKEKDQDTKWL